MRANRLFTPASTLASTLMGLAIAATAVGGPAREARADEEKASVQAVAEAPAPATQAPASETVDRLHAVLLDVMQNAEALGYSGRYDRLQPVVAELFDLDFMAQKSVGRHWKTASPEEQARLLDTFSRYTVANYAGRFTGWTGQEFTTTGEENSARGTKLVRTTLHDPTDEDVELDYRLRETDAGWRIVDIYFNGTVSELALRRSEYSSVIKREGFDALLAAIDERIAELTSAPAAGAS